MLRDFIVGLFGLRLSVEQAAYMFIGGVVALGLGMLIGLVWALFSLPVMLAIWYALRSLFVRD